RSRSSTFPARFTDTALSSRIRLHQSEIKGAATTPRPPRPRCFENLQCPASSRLRRKPTRQKRRRLNHDEMISRTRAVVSAGAVPTVLEDVVNGRIAAVLVCHVSQHY